MAIVQAAEAGDIETVEKLLDEDPRLADAKAEGVPPLWAAAAQGHREMVGLLLGVLGQVGCGLVAGRHGGHFLNPVTDGYDLIVDKGKPHPSRTRDSGQLEQLYRLCSWTVFGA